MRPRMCCSALLPSLLLALLLLPGCTLGELRHGRPLPDDAALSRLGPGCTRQEVLALLGPADEHKGTVPTGPLRRNDPVTLRVVSERDLFARRRWNWTHEVRNERVFSFLPVLTLFQSWRSVSRTDRITVVFDEQGLVSEVSVQRELQP